MTRPQPAPKLTEAQRKVLAILADAEEGEWTTLVALSDIVRIGGARHMHGGTPRALLRRHMIELRRFPTHGWAARITAVGLAALGAADPLSPDDASEGHGKGAIGVGGR